jgi:quercetin dioxygenase-like cupin family protein
MSETTSTTEHLWFLNTLVSIRVSEHEGTDTISVLEHQARHGDSPPMHLHKNEDEVFYVLTGELRFQVGNEEGRLSAGETFLAPKGVPHTYRVESSEGSRWLTITSKGDFERFVRTMSRPAERRELPEPSGAPTPEAAEALAAMARSHGIELVGPPLH